MTPASLAATLDALAPHRSPTLVAPAALGRLRALAASLPAALTRWLYLECRLGDFHADAAPQTDLIVNVEPDGVVSLIDIAAHFAADDAWRRVAALARAWQSSRALAEAVESLWLEFDVDGVGGGPPRPSVFVDFAESSYGGETAAHAARMFDALAALGAAPSSSLRRTLARCLTTLPNGATAPYLGVMLARPDAATTVRLCVHGLAASDALPYLRNVGWAGDAAFLDERPPAVVHLDVDADGRVRDQIGLEYTFDRLAQLRGDFAESSYLEQLVARGLLTAAQAGGLRQWGGYEIGVRPHELWESVTARWVNHVKVVGGGARPIVAKGYLSVHGTPRAQIASNR